MRLRIAEQWDLFCRRCMSPGGVSQIQKQEMRRCFYAGAEALLRAMMAGISSEPGMTPGDMETMVELHQELKDLGITHVTPLEGNDGQN
jgi:hypothetical protein